MRGLVRALVAGLPVVPLIAVITVTAAPAAHAENNGVGLTPAMGWSSWSFLRHGPTAANIEAQAGRHEEQRAGRRRVPATSTWTTSGTSARAARVQRWTSTAAG